MTERATGYYWVIFPYPNGDRHWEIGSWDAAVDRWVLFGSTRLWEDSQLVRIVDKRIDEPEAPTAKWCSWCKTDSHTDAECWSTRVLR